MTADDVDFERASAAAFALVEGLSWSELLMPAGWRPGASGRWLTPEGGEWEVSDDGGSLISRAARDTGDRPPRPRRKSHLATSLYAGGNPYDLVDSIVLAARDPVAGNGFASSLPADALKALRLSLGGSKWDVRAAHDEPADAQDGGGTAAPATALRPGVEPPPPGQQLDSSTSPPRSRWNATSDIRCVDWFEIWNSVSTEPDWLCRPLIERGRLVALYGPAKSGKSLLALEVAAALAAGKPVLDNEPAPPCNVMYVDYENSPRDFVERLRLMGYGPADLTNLRYVSFPRLQALTTAAGGDRLLRLAQAEQAELVVIDTVSRVLGGADESAAGTFAALYEHSFVKLKREGIAVLRLDHTGKDVDKGQRGSAAKNDDPDEVWELKARAETLTLTRTHTRTAHGADEIKLRRLAGPLRHERVTGVVPAASEPDQAAVDALIAAMDAAHLRPATGRDPAAELAAKLGLKVSTREVQMAVRERKARLKGTAELPAP